MAVEDMEVEETDAAAQQQPGPSSGTGSTIPEGSDGGAAEENSKIVTLWATVDGVESWVYPDTGSVFLKKLFSEFKDQTVYGNKSVNLDKAYYNTESNLPQEGIFLGCNSDRSEVYGYQKPVREGTHLFTFNQAASEHRCRRILYYDYHARKKGIANFVNNFRLERDFTVYPEEEVPLDGQCFSFSGIAQ